jgi:ribonuclease VapC
MVIDSSALVAIFLGQPEREIFRSLMIQAESRLISVVNVFETGVVLEAKGGMALSREYDLFLLRANIQVIAADAEQTELARSAWRKYGKGRHRAALNFGDCFAYALAKYSGESLLAKGNDFTLTDIEVAHKSNL